MAEEADPPLPAEDTDADGTVFRWHSRAMALVPAALSKARIAVGFPGRWRAIIDRLERVEPCISDLSSHPFFAKNSLCRELMQSVAATVAEAAELADRCRQAPTAGKLQMQSDLDALISKLDLNLRDCSLLVKTGVLGDGAPVDTLAACADTAAPQQANVSELLARLQIGNADAKHRAVDGLLKALQGDGKSVFSVLCRGNVSALIQLLAASTPPKVREKTATIICLLAESGTCENLFESEEVLPPLIRLAEYGSSVQREKSAITLHRLSMSADIGRSIFGYGGIRPLIEICQAGESIAQSAAAGTLKNLSAVPELRQALADEGIIKVMINLLECGILLGCKEYAAECLQHLTAENDSLRTSVISEGGLKSIIHYLDGPLPQEPAVGALRNLVGSASTENLLSLGLLPRIAHVLKDGSMGAQQAAASSICKISRSSEMKRLVGEHGCIPLLVRMLESKSNGAREVAAQAVAGLMQCPRNAKEIKKNEKAVPNLVQLLDPSPLNTAKKYAISCLLMLSSSKRLKKSMISHGAIGYLKKLSDMDFAGAKKLLERLQKGQLWDLIGGIGKW